MSKYGKKVATGSTVSNHTQSVYLFSGRSITPDKKPIINVKKNTSIYGRSSGASTDRTHNMNRNLSLTTIGGVATTAVQSRNAVKKDRVAAMKSKGSISSNSSYNHHTSNTKTSTSKTMRNNPGEEGSNELVLLEKIKMLKSENK